MLNQLSVGEIMHSYRDSFKIVNVLKTVRNKRIAEVDYTYIIEDLLQGFDVAHKLTEERILLTITRSNYRRGGTCWDLKFRRNSSNYAYEARTYFAFFISHIPANLNYGNRIRVYFNVNNLDVSLKNSFFDQFNITRNSRMHELVSLNFEDPSSIIDILLFLEDKMLINI